MFSKKKADKGKQRAEHSETEPLLSNQAESSSAEEGGPSTYSATDAPVLPISNPAQISRNPRKSYLWAGLSTIIVVLVLAIAVLLYLIASSYAPAAGRKEDLQEAFVWRGPSKVDVVNVTDDGDIWLKIEGWAGVDADVAMGLVEDDDTDGVWESIRRWTGRRAVRSFGTLQVEFPSKVNIQTADKRSTLFSLELPSLFIPITPALHSSTPPVFSPDPSRPASVPLWLTHFSILVVTHVEADPTGLLKFAKRCWSSGNISVFVQIDEVRAKGLGGWREWIHFQEKTLTLDIKVPLPLNRLPDQRDPIDLFTIEKYSVIQSPPPTVQLLLQATGSIPNLLPSYIQGGFPFQLSWAVGVVEDNSDAGLHSEKEDEEEHLAVVHTLPIEFAPSNPNITLSVAGFVIPPSPLPDNSTQSSALATFLESYLSNKPLPLRMIYQPSTDVPKVVNQIISIVSPITIPIPPIDPPLNLINEVTIEGMKVGTNKEGDGFVCSGTVVATVDIPKEATGVTVDVELVLPDVLIYNGPAPNGTTTLVTIASSAPPSPIPANAFGRLNPSEPIPSRLENGTLRAPFFDVPLVVLEGRDSVLSSFVSKIIFKGGAVAGVKGECDVKASVGGLGGGLWVRDIPVSGEVWISRP